MSVYNAENPKWFKESIESMLNQSIKPSQFVIVKDGPLTEKLDKVIDEYKNNEIFDIVPLEKNIGLAKALNEGLKHCRYEFVARMDSDDISLPHRCEKELLILTKRNVDVVGGAIEEFDEDPDIVTTKRIPPESEEEVLKYAKKRNPFNHPSVMFKKSAVEAAGGYLEYPYFEDYNLWATMLNDGFKGYNTKEVVLKMRTGGGLYKRRGGFKYAKYMYRFKKHLKDIGFLSFGQFLFSATVRFIVALIPTGARRFIYKVFLRK